MTTIEIVNQITRKATLAPTKDGAHSLYNDQLINVTDVEAVFKSNPKKFNLNLAKKNPKFKGKTENYRQGDVILYRNDELNLSDYLPTDSLIIAESFTTGHTHEFITGDATLYAKEGSGDLALVVREDSLWAHQEHALHNVKPGVYEIRWQQTIVDNTPIRVID